ncbi:MAG: Flp pilus assembly complex ATPase component TadA [Veillonella sp.]|nr:Flp pilus assembly complex ATPase component TadA [Veillonella sp.]
MKSWLTSVLDYALDREATDIHVEEQGPVCLREESGLQATSFIATSEHLLELYKEIGIKGSDDIGQSVDTAFSYGQVRVRVHLYKSSGKVCATLRLLPKKDLSLDGDGDKELLTSICQMRDGLILITGPTGSGKSFTLALCIAYINAHFKEHIITLEDPIEFVFTNEESLIHQRQLGLDVETMASGIRDAMREDPDVIMVGELRDRETVEAALHAAETGHLVLATMHTQRAIMAVNRIIAMFPGEQQDEVRNQLSQVLKVVICQRLVRLDGQFISLRDILVNTPAVANLIRMRKEPQIVSLQELQPPMRTFPMAVEEAGRQWGHKETFNHALGGLE